MSELKAFNMPRYAGVFTTHEVYLKSEADKCIAEKDKEIAELKEQVQEERSAKVNYKISANDLSDGLKDAYEEIKHQKYKRCLAMAALCTARATVSEAVHWDNRKFNYYLKWHDRWLILADKIYKETK